MHFLCSPLSLHNLCCLSMFHWYFLHILLHFDSFVFIFFQCLSYTANGRPEHITTSKWAGTGKLADSPFPRCSALLLPRIVINFSSSVPNFPSPAAYKSCNGRPHTDVHTLSLSHTHKHSHWFYVLHQTKVFAFFFFYPCSEIFYHMIKYQNNSIFISVIYYCFLMN